VQFMRSATMVDPSVRDLVLRGLSDIVDAVAEHAGKRASAATLQHLCTGERIIEQMYPQIVSTPQFGSLRLNSPRSTTAP
jgi:DNA-binding FadR family transcriptional regulator